MCVASWPKGNSFFSAAPRRTRLGPKRKFPQSHQASRCTRRCADAGARGVRTRRSTANDGEPKEAVSAWQGEVRLRGLQRLPVRQAEGPLNVLQRLLSRRAEIRVQGVQSGSRGSVDSTRGQAPPRGQTRPPRQTRKRRRAGAVHHPRLLRVRRVVSHAPVPVVHTTRRRISLSSAVGVSRSCAACTSPPPRRSARACPPPGARSTGTRGSSAGHRTSIRCGCFRRA